VANLVSLYPKTTFIIWEPDIILPSVNFIFFSHWVPTLANKIWQCDILEVLFASVERFWFNKAWDWESVPISIKHGDAVGCSDMTIVLREFVRRQAWLIDVKIFKKGPIMVSSFCKDHQFGTSVTNEASRQTLTPEVHSEVPGFCHGEGLYPASLAKKPQFLLG
jgi:hypothetical protein